MSQGTPVRQLSPPALTTCVSVGAWSCALLLALCLAGGCQTEKQERFHLYNQDGVRLFEKGDYAGARDHFEIALSLEDAKNANLLYNLGQCCDRLGQEQQAESYYKQCLEVSANHADCRHALAVLLYRGGRRVEADRMIESWLSAEPELGAAYAEDGWRLRRGGEFTLAVGRFQQALHYDPRNLRAMVELGQLAEEHDRAEFALAMYVRALEVNPKQPELEAHVKELRAKGVRKPLPE